MGGTTHVTPPASEEAKGDEMDKDIIADANPEAKVIPITTISEPVIDELSKPEVVADAAPTEAEGKE